MWTILFRDRYRRQFVEAGRSLGLTFQQARRFDEFGTLRGTVGNREVLAEPEPFGHYSVRLGLERPVALELNTWKPPHRPDPGMSSFRSGNSDFDRIFATRYASRRLARRVHEAKELTQGFADFARRWKIRGNSRFERHGLLVMYIRGRRGYEPDAIFPDLVALADSLAGVLAGAAAE